MVWRLGLLTIAMSMFAGQAHAVSWRCGPGGAGASVDVVSSTIEANLEVLAVDHLVSSAYPDQKLRLTDVAFVPGFDSLALDWLKAARNKTHRVALLGNEPDYLGRLKVKLEHANAADGDWREDLLESGLVLFLPETNLDTAALFRAEDTAINAGLGLWSERRDLTSYLFNANASDNGLGTSDIKDALGRFVVFDGVLRSVEHQEWRSYLNFGVNWREDFTIALDNAMRDAFATDGDYQTPLDGWVGKRIRVRGTVENRGGPYIGLQNPAWMCVQGQ